MEEDHQPFTCMTNRRPRSARGRKKKEESDPGDEQLVASCMTRMSLVQIQATICAAQVNTALATITTASARSYLASENNVVIFPRNRGLRDCALALLPFQSTTHPEQDLYKLLKETTIRRPHTVQLMLDHLDQARTALLSLTPCQVPLAEFLTRSRQDPMATLLYKVVREAVRQCIEVAVFYRGFDPSDRLTGRMLPPFPRYDDCAVMQELSNAFWEAEDEIQRMHREASTVHEQLDPGFSVECIAILCHAFEASRPSPVGLNLFYVG